MFQRQVVRSCDLKTVNHSNNKPFPSLTIIHEYRLHHLPPIIHHLSKGTPVPVRNWDGRGGPVRGGVASDGGGAGEGDGVKKFLVLRVPPAKDSDQGLAGTSYH